MQKENFVAQIVFEILKFKKLSQELDFSQPCHFHRFSKVVYHLKPKNHIDGPNLSSKYVLLIFSEHLGHP